MQFAETSLSELAIAIPMATEIFRSKRLDFCCGGKQSLKDACEKKNINLAEIISKLEILSSKDKSTPDGRPLGEITKFIEQRYHDDLRRRLPELLMLAKKVEQVHGDHSNCPTGLAALLNELQTEMLLHMSKEENILFPMISQGRGALAQMPIRIMMTEHEGHGKELDEIRKLTHDFNPPEGACGTWRALYSGLEKLEAELMEHIHLENNILFPRALAQG